MKRKILAGTIGLAALAGMVAPAIAQYYPPPPPQGGIAGAIIDQAIRQGRYGQYPYGNYGYDRYGRESHAIDRCAQAVEARLNGYSNNYYRGGRYNRYRNHGRVEGITRVDRKNYGLKVYGVASSGYGGYDGWNRPGYGNYGYGAGADLRWECKVYSNGRIRDIDIKRRSADWRGY